MARWIKNILNFLVVAFIIYFIYTRPEAAGNLLQTIGDAFDSLGRFFESALR